MWMKDMNGNWYCDGPLCTGCCSSSFVWDKNEDGAWFLSESSALSATFASFPAASLSLAG